MFNVGDEEEEEEEEEAAALQLYDAWRWFFRR